MGVAKVASAPTESAPPPVPRKLVPPGMPVTVPPRELPTVPPRELPTVLPRELPTVPEVAPDVEVEVEVRSDRKK